MPQSEWRSITYQSSCSDPTPRPAMAFNPVTLPDDVVEDYDEQKRRWYVKDGIRMGSITTILKETDREGELALKKWRRRIGEDAAMFISDEAAETGTRWHNFCEKFDG